jgi:hypothetical protein
MNSANITIAIIALLSVLMIWWRWGWSSFLGQYISVSFLYAIPAIVGIVLPFHITGGTRGVFSAPSMETVYVYGTSWIAYLMFTALINPTRIFKSNNIEREKLAVFACFLLMIFGYIFICIEIEPLFFLQPRGSIEYSLLLTIWRWLPLFGLILAVGQRSYVFAAIFAVFIIIYFIAGDRTIIAIAICSLVLFYHLNSGKRNILPNIPIILIGFFVLALMMLGKPVYLSVKNPELFQVYMSKDFLLSEISSFEPFGTFNILDYVVNKDLSISFSQFIFPILYNITFFPSFFGLETNLFYNIVLNNIDIELSYGIAGNIFAHGYAAFGILGIPLLAFLIVISLFGCEMFAIRFAGVWRVFFLVCGATIVIYINRNGLDNFLSFIRQIFVVTVMILMTKNILASVGFLATITRDRNG